MGEASPSYLRSLTAARDIAAVAPDARIVAILREPVSFLYSLHLQMVRNHVQRELDFGKALAAGSEGNGCANGGERVHRSASCTTSSSCAATTRFRSEQVLALIYDDFRADNEAAVRSVSRLLDVDSERQSSRSMPIRRLRRAPSDSTTGRLPSDRARPAVPVA